MHLQHLYIVIWLFLCDNLTMNVDKLQILRKAREYGADDAAVVGGENKQGTSVIVLFCRYFAAPAAPKGNMALSPYYVASNRGYMAAKKLAAYMVSLGANAQHNTQINPKTYALKHGGHIGKNGFYYHGELGSLVNLQTIVTDCVTPDPDAQSSSACSNCGACFDACPSGGVGDMQNCLRYHSNSLIPQHLRGDLYQLLGCEKCQTACPQNSTETRETPFFRTDELVAGMHTKELKALAGSNMARANRVSSQAALYAGSTGQTSLIAALEKLAETALSPTREHSLWAAKLLKGGPHD